MGKILGVLLLAGAAVVFINREKISDFKHNVIEIVNPAAKEKRLITAIQHNLQALDDLINNESFEQDSPTARQIASLMNEAKQTLEELQKTNEELDLGANLSNLLSKVIPLGKAPSPTWLPPGQECPDIK